MFPHCLVYNSSTVSIFTSDKANEDKEVKKKKKDGLQDGSQFVLLSTTILKKNVILRKAGL